MERIGGFMGQGAGILSTLLLLSTLQSAHAASIGVNACIGTGKPDLSDGRYVCGVNDVEGHGETGQHLAIDWQATDGDEIARVVVDFNGSTNADVIGRSAFLLDNYDGANMYWLDISNNVLDARFSQFPASVDNFYLGLDIDRRNPRQGTPVDPDLDGTTIRIETSYGRRFSCTFHHVDLLSAYAGEPLPMGNVLRLRWMLPCMEQPLLELEPELIDRFSGVVLQFERDWCDENPKSALCQEPDGKSK